MEEATDHRRPTEAEDPDSDLPMLDEQQTDWTIDPVDAIPPWCRNDRALIDAARSAAGTKVDASDPERSAALARDLRRLADLNADSILDDNEFIAGVRARLPHDT